MAKILIVVDAPGPAKALIEVLPLLEKYLLILTIKESPTKILEKFNPIRCDSNEEAEKKYREFNPDLVFIAISSLVLGPYVNLHVAELAKKDGKKVICFQDVWANHRWPMNFKMLKFCDKVLVPDHLAANFLKEDGYEGEIVITGNPIFDRFHKINVAAERKKLRAVFHVPENAFVILHAGTGTPQSWQEDEVTFRFLADAFREFKKSHPNAFLISRVHPRDERKDPYKTIAPDIDFLDTTSVEMTDELLPVADVVVAMYSTNLIEACHMRLPGIGIMLPEGGKKRLERISLRDFPPNSIGATIGIYEPSIEKLNAIFEKLLSDKKFKIDLRANQEKFFPAPTGSTAQKILVAILENAT